MHVAPDRGEHDLALARLVGAGHVRLEVGHRCLHHLGGGQHERQLHLPGTEQLADRLHAVQQHVVDDLQGGPLGQGSGQVRLEADALAVDDPPLEPVPQRQRGQLRGPAGLQVSRVHALEQLKQPGQRVVALPPPVVHQVQRHLTLLVGNPRDRDDPRRVHDRRVKSGPDAFGQEDRVQHGASGGLETERHVRHAQRGLHGRVPALQLGDRLDGLDRVAAGLLLAGGDGEGQAVDDDVLDAHAPVPGQVGDEPLGDGDLPVGGAGLALLVDGQRDHRGAVLAYQRHHLRDPGVGPVAVLVVDRVDDGPAAGQLEAGLDHGGFGGVEHQREGGGGGQPAHHLAHVGRAVPAHVVDAHVEQVRAVPGLVPGDLDAVLETALEHRVAECLRPVGVGALADGQERGVLAERHVGVQRSHSRLGTRLARGHRAPAHPVRQHRDVLGRRAAAAADQGQAELPGEPVMRVRQPGRGQRVARPVGGQLRQAGVRLTGQRYRGVRGQISEVLAHLPRAGRAVQPDHVDAERLQSGQRRPDLAAEQHHACGLDRHLHDDQRLGRHLGCRPPGADDGRLRLQQVVAGLDDQRVGAAPQQSLGVGLVGVAQFAERDVAERGQLRARAHGAEHPARAAGRGPAVGGHAGHPGRGQRELPGPVGDPVLTEVAEIGAERVGGDAIRARFEVGLVDRGHDVRPGHVQYLVAAFITGEIIDAGLAGLEHGAHRPVGHHHSLGQCGP